MTTPIQFTLGRGVIWINPLTGGHETGRVLNGYSFGDMELVQPSYNGRVVLVPTSMLEPWPHRSEWEPDLKKAIVKEPVQ